MVDGRIIIRDNFDKLLENNNKIFIFGEDVGMIGDVNQGLEGLQIKYGKNRVFDTGIRESTISWTRYWYVDEGFKTYCRNSIFRLYLIRITDSK